MKPLVVAILGITWVVVLVPPLVRSWIHDRRAASMERPRRRRPPGGETYWKPAANVRVTSSTAAQHRYREQRGRSPRPLLAGERRRRTVLGALVVAVVFTAVGAGTGVHAVIGLNLLTDALLVLYVCLLVRRRRAIEHRAIRTYWSRAA